MSGFPRTGSGNDFLFGEKMATTNDETLVDEDESVEDELESEQEEVADSGEDDADPPPRVIGDEELSAVIRFAGKQFRVRSGSFFEASVSEGKDQWIVEDVLVATNEKTMLGTPKIEGARVVLELRESFLSRKVINFKKRRRKHSSKRTKGHRQPLFRYVVTSIDVPGLGKSEFVPGGRQEQPDQPQ